MKNPNAFPSTFKIVDRLNHTVQETHCPGMSLRDWFAGQMLSGFVANPTITTTKIRQIAKEAYMMADAMLKERENHEK